MAAPTAASCKGGLGARGMSTGSTGSLSWGPWTIATPGAAMLPGFSDTKLSN